MATIDFDKSGGLIPAIAQDADRGVVLMMAWMNREAYEKGKGDKKGKGDNVHKRSI